MIKSTDRKANWFSWGRLWTPMGRVGLVVGVMSAMMVTAASAATNVEDDPAAIVEDAAKSITGIESNIQRIEIQMSKLSAELEKAMSGLRDARITLDRAEAAVRVNVELARQARLRESRQASRNIGFKEVSPGGELIAASSSDDSGSKIENVRLVLEPTVLDKPVKTASVAPKKTVEKTRKPKATNKVKKAKKAPRASGKTYTAKLVYTSEEVMEKDKAKLRAAGDSNFFSAGRGDNHRMYFGIFDTPGEGGQRAAYIDSIIGKKPRIIKN